MPEVTLHECNFHKWCLKCEFDHKGEFEEPCIHCITVPCNEGTDKPVDWKEKQ